MVTVRTTGAVFLFPTDSANVKVAAAPEDPVVVVLRNGALAVGMLASAVVEFGCAVLMAAAEAEIPVVSNGILTDSAMAVPRLSTVTCVLVVFQPAVPRTVRDLEMVLISVRREVMTDVSLTVVVSSDTLDAVATVTLLESVAVNVRRKVSVDVTRTVAFGPTEVLGVTSVEVEVRGTVKVRRMVVVSTLRPLPVGPTARTSVTVSVRGAAVTRTVDVMVTASSRVLVGD